MQTGGGSGVYRQGRREKDNVESLLLYTGRRTRSEVMDRERDKFTMPDNIKVKNKDL